MSHKTRVAVSRASQTHQIPQAVLAHSGPVISTRLAKRTPSSAEERARMSHLRSRFHRKRMLAAHTSFYRSRREVKQGPEALPTIESPVEPEEFLPEEFRAEPQV